MSHLSAAVAMMSRLFGAIGSTFSKDRGGSLSLHGVAVDVAQVTIILLASCSQNSHADLRLSTAAEVNRLHSRLIRILQRGPGAESMLCIGHE